MLEYYSFRNEQEYSAAFQTRLTCVAHLVKLFLGKERLVEVGGGKGYFLKALTALGCRITGFDPTYDGNNPHVRKLFVEPSVSLTTERIILRHVFEHVPGTVAFLNEIREAEVGRGLI